MPYWGPQGGAPCGPLFRAGRFPRSSSRFRSRVGSSNHLLRSPAPRLSNHRARRLQRRDESSRGRRPDLSVHGGACPGVIELKRLRDPWRGNGLRDRRDSGRHRSDSSQWRTITGFTRGVFFVGYAAAVIERMTFFGNEEAVVNFHGVTVRDSVFFQNGTAIRAGLFSHITGVTVTSGTFGIIAECPSHIFGSTVQADTRSS